MPANLKLHFNKELDLYFKSFESGELTAAWHHLERAHIIGQSYPYQHSYVHWKMLQFGIRIKSVKEVIGQIPRLLVGGIKSFVGKIPVGNTGGANVPMLKAMEVTEDLKRLMGNQ